MTGRIAVTLAMSVLLTSCDLPRTSYTLEGTEAGGTVWIKSCVDSDELRRVRVLRDGVVMWRYELVGANGLALGDPVDLRQVSQSSLYRRTAGDSRLLWVAGDQIVVESTRGQYLSWALGDGSPKLTLEELRDVKCTG